MKFAVFFNVEQIFTEIVQKLDKNSTDIAGEYIQEGHVIVHRSLLVLTVENSIANVISKSRDTYLGSDIVDMKCN